MFLSLQIKSIISSLSVQIVFIYDFPNRPRTALGTNIENIYCVAINDRDFKVRSEFMF